MGQHAKLREKLKQELATVQERLDRVESDRRRERNELSADFEEQATVRENDEVLDHLHDQLMSQSQKLAEAIQQIDQGKYGICQTCGEAIGSARLEALPHATECIDCASKRTA